MAGAVPGNPLAARRAFGVELRRRRDEAGLTAEDVGGTIGCSASKITRIETGHRSANPEDFDALMELYRVAEDDYAHLHDLFKQGRRRTKMWWHAFGDVLSTNYAHFLGYEHEAVSTFEYQVVYIPALLQTEAYARAVTAVGFAALGPDQIDSLVEVRMRRQRRIHEDEPLRFSGVITQAALEFQVGGPEAHLAQLRHLREAMKLPNISLRVIPFSKGADGTQPGAFSIFDFAGQDTPAAAFAETVTGNVFIEDALGLRRLNRLADYLVGAALSAEQSVELIEQTERKLAST